MRLNEEFQTVGGILLPVRIILDGLEYYTLLRKESQGYVVIAAGISAEDVLQKMREEIGHSSIEPCQ